jgi:predicted  nucleic acid-binding Zn-ribbon protein
VSIKAKLDALERQVKDNAEFRKVVADLKNIVVEKEKEIATLKKQIAAKDKKIKEQGEVIQEQSSKIETQMNTIMKQNLRLENEIKKQAQMLYEAGLAFESLGDDSPEIKRKKDKAKVENLTKQMYQNALEYYQQAFDSGYSAAEERISAVKRKMTYL